MDKLKHAFAVKPEYDSAVLGLPDLLEKLAKAVVNRGMETPAIIVLESMVPLSFLGSQAMLAALPLVKMASDGADYREVAEALEDRKTVRLLAGRIEQLAHSERVSS